MSQRERILKAQISMLRFKLDKAEGVIRYQEKANDGMARAMSSRQSEEIRLLNEENANLRAQLRAIHNLEVA